MDVLTLIDIQFQISNLKILKGKRREQWGKKHKKQELQSHP